MILRRSYVLVAFVAALAACGGSDNSASSVCSKGASVVSSLPAKYTPCGDTPSFDFPAPSACEATLAQCTSGDRDALNGVADCLNGLPTCSPDTKSQFESRAAACVAPVENLSAACKTALGVDSTASALCTKAQTVVSGVKPKVDACLGAGSSSQVPEIPQGAACEAALAQCSDTDRAALNTALDCFANIGSCPPETGLTFQQKALACLNGTNAISAGCRSLLPFPQL